MLIADFGFGIEGGGGLDLYGLTVLGGKGHVHQSSVAATAHCLFGTEAFFLPLGSRAGLDDFHLFDDASGVLTEERERDFLHAQRGGTEQSKSDEAKAEEFAEDDGLRFGKSHGDRMVSECN